MGKAVHRTGEPASDCRDRPPSRYEYSPGLFLGGFLARSPLAALPQAPAISQFTTAGTGSTLVNTGGVGPNDVAFDSLGNLYVAANGTRAIQKYNPAGVFQFSWSTGGRRPQHLAFVPVPEPASYALTAAVAAAGLLVRRGRRRLRDGK